MKHYRTLFLALLIVTTLFVCSSCDGEKASATTYTVQVPQFAEGNGSDAKVGIPITVDEMSNVPFIKHFFAYRISPPITGFKEQKIEKGSKINTKLFGHDITLSMTVAENGNYIFEGENDSEYIKVEISKDNKTFNYVHALILDVINVPNAEDEFDVVEGAGEILSANHFDSYGTAYYLSEGRVALYNFLLHGKNDGKMAWFCYDGVLKDIQGAVSFTKASDYKTNCIDVVKERVSGESKYYVAVFDKNGLVIDSVIEDTSATEEQKLETVITTNGLGDVNLTTYEDCIDRINNTLGFSSWNVDNSATKWNVNIN